MVNMTNRPNVQVRLVALELLLSHLTSPNSCGWTGALSCVGCCVGDVGGSGGGIRTRDPTIMSRVLLPTELLRRVEAGHRPAPASPLTDSNRRPLPYHGSALPTELRGRGRQDSRAAARPGACCAAVAPSQRWAAMRTRLAEPRDAEAIRAIYNLEVLESTVTFDLVPRTLAEQVEWIDEHSGGHPAIVAVDDTATVVGFASLSPYRPRPAYAPTVEDSVYVHRESRGKGIGAAAARAICVRLATRPRLPFRDRPASSAATTHRSRCTTRAASNRSAASARSAASSAAGSTSC